jgi:hypothetical protein
LSQYDFRRVGDVALFEWKGGFLGRLDLVFCGLCEPIPFSLGFAERPLTALGFQFAQAGSFFHRQFHSIKVKTNLPGATGKLVSNYLIPMKKSVLGGKVI